jgi:hypothetical protein
MNLNNPQKMNNTHDLALAEDFARTVNHDLGYDQHLKRLTTNYDMHRITKFDALSLLE